jgi:hypothetical protein
MSGVDQAVEVGVVAEPGVDPEVVEGVVAVRRGGEDRSEQQPVAAQLDHVVQPRRQLRQPVLRPVAPKLVEPVLRPDEPQGKTVPPDCGGHPIHGPTVCVGTSGTGDGAQTGRRAFD